MTPRVRSRARLALVVAGLVLPTAGLATPAVAATTPPSETSVTTPATHSPTPQSTAVTSTAAQSSAPGAGASTPAVASATSPLSSFAPAPPAASAADPAPVLATAPATAPAAAPPPEFSAATMVGDCPATLAIAQVGGGSYWDPLTVKLDGSFPDGCTIPAGSTLTVAPTLPSALALQNATYPFTGGTMTVSGGAVTFTFTEAFASATSRVFGGSVTVTMNRAELMPGSTVDVTWSGAVTTTTTLQVPSCPGCASMPTTNLKWASISAAQSGFNYLVSGVNTKTFTQLMVDAGPVVTLEDRLAGAQKCHSVELQEITARSAGGSETVGRKSAVPCGEDGVSIGPATVPADWLVAGHYYKLHVIAKTTEYQKDGYSDTGTVTIAAASQTLNATAAWQSGQAYGGFDGPTSSPTSVPTSPDPSPSPTQTPEPTSSSPSPEPTSSPAPTQTPSSPTPSSTPSSPSPEPTDSPAPSPTSSASTSSAPTAPDPEPTVPTAPSASSTTPQASDTASARPHQESVVPPRQVTTDPAPMEVTGGNDTTPAPPQPSTEAAVVAAPAVPGRLTPEMVAERSGGLPETGTQIAATILYAGLLVGAGSGLISVSRRRG